MTSVGKIRETYEKGKGIVRLLPVFIPRNFSTPGKRLKLHPDDYYALGMERGAIKERWFSSVTPANNGQLAPADEGMSYVSLSGDGNERVLLRDFIAELGEEMIGSDLKKEYGTFPMYAKFFDYNDPLFHHMHLTQESAERVGTNGKPEAYYFPPQLNNHLGTFPHTYFGFDPSVTKAEVRKRILQFRNCDNRITELSRAYRIELGTGWYTPPGVVHAPGSVLTYEPQWNADCNVVYENVTSGEINSYDSLTEFCPTDKKNDIDYIMDLMDWEENVLLDYRGKYFRSPIIAGEAKDIYMDKWVAYANPYICAKELTVKPGQTAVIRDPACYGCIFVQGYGKFGVYDCESPVMIRFGQMTADEFFVSEKAAREGVRVTNLSAYDDLVMLRHFGPNNPESPKQLN
ncbi:hypothetical protein [Marispirochaeta sp.]|jgi:hypothetical protein|uniref:hypothetical protein n=1 Tax=Marispirochaeta sp. TaxID=2038653 RepID=UPI0029C62C8C|nr:hypothetical protein [Marispirochaeta sp.]